jgi:hypothetical protein
VLYLNPPFLVVNGVSVLPDHADELQWYYLPLGPQIVTRSEGGSEIPAFSLIRFRGSGEPGGGLLNFDVHLGVSDDALDEIATEIRGQMSLRDKPRLAPVPLEDGTVRLLLLGHATGADPGASPAGSETAAAEPAAQRFVVNVEHSAKPGLYGDNRAAFSALLDEDGAVLVDRALAGELAPIGVVYALDYVALRPAYSVRLSIDWDRVQKHMDESFGSSLLFFSSDINEAVDKLIEERAIDMQIDTFVVETDENKGVIKNRDAAVAEVQSMITDTFFTATINPTQKEEDGWDKASKFIHSLSPVALVQGLTPSFSYSKNKYERTDRKRLDVTMSERAAVKRTIYPQGHLSGIAAAIRDSGRPLTDFVRDVDLDDPWYQRRRIEVIPRVNFGSGHVSSVGVEMRYGGQVKSALFAAGSEAPVTLEWASTVEDGRMVLPVQAEVEVNLAQVEDIARPNQLTTTFDSVEGEKFEVRTEDLFALMTIPVLTDGVPWDRWSHVEVALRYTDEANGIRQESTLDLSSELPAWNYPIYVVDQARTALDFRLTYHGNGRPDHVVDWQTTDEGQVRIRNPFSTKREVTITPTVSWVEVDRILLDMKYEDAANDVRFEQSYEFTEAAAASQAFAIDLRDPTRRRVDYDVIVLFKDGRQQEIPKSSTTENRLLLSPTLSPRQVIRVAVDLSQAAAQGIKDAVVSVTPGSEGGTAKHLTFVPGSLAQEVDLDDLAELTYRYAAVFHYTNGMQRSIASTESHSSDLQVAVP